MFFNFLNKIICVANKEHWQPQHFDNFRKAIKALSDESFFEFEDTDGDKYRLRMQLSIVPKDYAIEVRIDEKYIKAFFTHMDKLIQIAMQYYHVEAGNLIKDLAIMFPDDNIASLGINPKNRTLCLAEKGNVRIGVLCFYVDKEGKPLQFTE